MITAKKAAQAMRELAAILDRMPDGEFMFPPMINFSTHSREQFDAAKEQLPNYRANNLGGSHIVEHRTPAGGSLCVSVPLSVIGERRQVVREVVAEEWYVDEPVSCVAGR